MTLTIAKPLAEKINVEHAAAMAKAREAIVHARNAGQALLEAKTQCSHGAWLLWLQENCTVSDRQAQRYMRLAQRWPELEAKTTRVSDLSIRAALSLLEEPAAEVSALPGREETEAQMFARMDLKVRRWLMDWDLMFQFDAVDTTPAEARFWLTILGPEAYFRRFADNSMPWGLETAARAAETGDYIFLNAYLDLLRICGEKLSSAMGIVQLYARREIGRLLKAEHALQEHT